MVYVDLEPVPFHKGFYAVDMTFFFNVGLDVFQAPAAPQLLCTAFLSLTNGLCCMEAKAALKSLAPTIAARNWTNKIHPSKTCRRPAYRSPNRSALPPSCVNIANLVHHAVGSQTASVTGTAETSVCKAVLRPYTSRSESLPLCRSNVMCKCSSPLMISVFRKKSVPLRPTTLANYLVRSISPPMNSSRRKSGMLVGMTTVAAVGILPCNVLEHEGENIPPI